MLEAFIHDPVLGRGYISSADSKKNDKNKDSSDASQSKGASSNSSNKDMGGIDKTLLQNVTMLNDFIMSLTVKVAERENAMSSEKFEQVAAMIDDGLIIPRLPGKDILPRTWSGKYWSSLANDTSAVRALEAFLSTEFAEQETYLTNKCDAQRRVAATIATNKSFQDQLPAMTMYVRASEANAREGWSCSPARELPKDQMRALYEREQTQ